MDSKHKRDLPSHNSSSDIFDAHISVDTLTHKYKTPIFLFIMIMIALLIGGVFYSSHEIKLMKEYASSDLSAIADLKVRQISDRARERYDDAQQIYDMPILQDMAAHFIEDPTSSPYTSKLLYWMQSYQRLNDYSLVALFDTQGKMLLSIPKHTHQLSLMHLSYIKDAVNNKKIIFGDLHFENDETGKNTKDIRYSYWIPVFDPLVKTTKAVGVWLVQIDPNQFLFPLVQSWPVISKSAETLLVRKEGDEVVYLNELRHRKNTALNLRFIISQHPKLPAAIAVQGREGVFEGEDYRGIPVLSVVRKVPNTPWYLVTKIDKAEIFRPINLRVIYTIIIMVFLTIIIALTIGLLERQKNTEMLRDQLKLEQDKARLQEDYQRISNEWQTTFDSISDVIWLLGSDYKIIRSNHSIEHILGYSSEEVISKYCWNITHGLEEALSKCPYQTMQQTKSRAESEILIDDKWLQISVDPILNEQKEIIGVVQIIRDITEKKRIENELQESEIRLKSIIDNAPFGAHTYELRPDNRLILIGANLSADNILKIDNQALIGLELLEAFPGNAKTDIPKIYRQVAMGAENYQTEHVSYQDDKIAGAFEVHAINIGHNRLTVFFRDVTEKRKAEEAIRILNEELEQRVTERTAQLISTNHELEAFTYSVSHDLRSPLRGIDGWGQALLDDYNEQLDEQGKTYLHKIRSETQRMGVLIEALLDLSRINKVSVTNEAVNLSEIVEHLLIKLQKESPQRAVTTVIEPNLTAFGDKHLLEIALNNLIDNAWKYTQYTESAMIEFGRTSVDNEPVFYIRDNGAGFDMKYSDKLFNAFHRMHKASEFPGTGVGLATVQRIILKHGGNIWAEAETGKGATFYFKI